MDGNFRDLIEGIGIVSFAVTGMIVANSHGVNKIGTLLVALAAGLGGGTVRDIMLNVRPFLWETMQIYPAAIFILTLGFVFLPRVQQFLSQDKKLLLAIIEVLAVASLGIAGADKAMSLGQNWQMIAIYGVISGAFGGVIRDVLVNEMPLLFKPAALFSRDYLSSA